jgi:sugar O-acyltransferase (sialic acid O-acetyltransferase NeuD family)
MGLVIVSGTSGQHATVVYECARLSGHNVDGFVIYDLNEGVEILDCHYLGALDKFLAKSSSDRKFIIACGSNNERKNLTNFVMSRGGHLQSVQHPQSIVSPSAHIAPGCAILAGAIVGPRASLGRSTIVNHGAVVDHDCSLSDYVNICPGVCVGGSAKLSEGVYLGLNASVIQGVNIGAWTKVGAGAVVLSDLPDHVTAVGVPARILAKEARVQALVPDRKLS